MSTKLGKGRESGIAGLSGDVERAASKRCRRRNDGRAVYELNMHTVQNPHRDSEALMRGEGRTYILIVTFLLEGLLREYVARRE